MEPERKLTAESAAAFQEGIGLEMSRWSALQLAVENEWGGRDSRLTADQLRSDVFSWFLNTPPQELYIDDLEDMLAEGMDRLNTTIDDGSIEEVAEKLMIMHQECVDSNFISIERLREALGRRVAPQHVRQVVNDNDDSDDDDDGDRSVGRDDSSNMMVVTQGSHSVDMPVNEPKTRPAAQAEDGWEVVGPRKNRGRRN